MNPKILIAGGAVGLSVIVPVVTLNSSSSTTIQEAHKLDLVSATDSEGLSGVESDTELSPSKDGRDSSESLSQTVNRSEDSGQVTVRDDSSSRQNSLGASGSLIAPKAKSLETPSQTKSRTQTPPIPQKPKPKYVECKEVGRANWQGKLIMCYDPKDNKKVKFTFVESLNTAAKRRIDGKSYEIGDQMEIRSTNTLSILVLGIGNGVMVGNRSVWLDLPRDKKEFSYQNRQMNKDKCVVEWKTDESTGERIDWTVKC